MQSEVTTNNYRLIKSEWLAFLFLATGLLCTKAFKVYSYNDIQSKADQGDPAAQYKLGLIYASGKGVAKDHGEAAKWFIKSAEQGFATAQFHLGFMYDGGIGVAKDRTDAIKWWIKAAEQNNANAQRQLGSCYQFGRGAEQDYLEAYAWYNLAAEKLSTAADNRDELEIKLSSQQIADAQKLARDCQARQFKGCE